MILRDHYTDGSPFTTLTGHLFDTRPSMFFTARKRSLGQGNILHLFVILFIGGSTWAGTPPGRSTPPGQVPPAGTTPLPVHPQAGTPPGRYTHPWAGTPPRQCMLGYGQQADGTHPTGMHSCCNFILMINKSLTGV